MKKLDNPKPCILSKLREKLKTAQEIHSMQRSINRAYRMYRKNKASLENSTLPEQAKALIRAYRPEYSSNTAIFPPSTLKGNLKKLKWLESKIEEITSAGEQVLITIKYDAFDYEETESRILFRLDGKPTPEIKELLKSYRFLWSPSRDAWARKNTTVAKDVARRTIKAIQKRGW